MRIHIQDSIMAFFTIFFVINYFIFRYIMKAPRLNATPVKRSLKERKRYIIKVFTYFISIIFITMGI